MYLSQCIAAKKEYYKKPGEVVVTIFATIVPERTQSERAKAERSQAEQTEASTYIKKGSNYGFIDYFDRRFSALAIISLNGRHMFGQPVNVNWAYASGKREDTTGRPYCYFLDLLDLSPEGCKGYMGSEDVKEPSNGDAPKNNSQYTTVYVGNFAPEETLPEPKASSSHSAKRLWPSMKVLVCILVAPPLALWPVCVVMGNIISGLAYGFLGPILAILQLLVKDEVLMGMSANMKSCQSNADTFTCSLLLGTSQLQLEYSPNYYAA
ncbi:Nucleolysin TIAR [Artemisia annua]|uniref:Nucleolysin TIAR n=1 Tax=Artemisia annua TaxID=35608 RepID=A0A2U1PK80_ARTAN|nr:Nucleolysin TIAR [Artemisia annua]